MADAPVIKQRANTMYDNMDFPQAPYAEFPMAVPVVDGKVMPTPYDANKKPHPIVIVESQEELDALTGGDVDLVELNPHVEEAPMRVKTDDDVKDALLIQAKQLGLKVDPKWTSARIEDTIKEHLTAKGSGDVV